MSDSSLWVDQHARSVDADRVADRSELATIASPPLSADSPDPDDFASSPIVLEVHGSLSEIEPEWRAFEAHADCTPFQIFDWLATWQRHIGARHATVPAIVVGRDRDGEVVVILPLAIERRGPLRRLTFLGSALCDYNAPLIAEDISLSLGADGFTALWRRAIARLRVDRRFRFDLIDLQKMPETVGSQKNPLVDLPVLAHPSGAHVATLDGDWERFYAARRSASTRKRERRQLKQLAEHGDITFLDVCDPDDIRRTMDVLMAQKGRSLARLGVENFFLRPGYRDFFHSVAESPGHHVSRLDVGPTVAAANLGLKFRDCYYLVLSSYHDGDIARFGPGRAHLHEVIRHAIGGGFRRFDFTIGDEPYKRDWSDIEVRVFDHLAAATLRGRVALAVTVAYRRTKRFIKQTPALWHAFSKARALGTILLRRRSHRSAAMAGPDTESRTGADTSAAQRRH
jgi:CelD/BcsL family acetyltransferase involved in cellulose biosynthesis